MARDLPQISFGGGIMSPATYARMDLQKFSTGVARADNYFVRSEGGISNRAGFEFIKETKDSANVSRLISFRFNEEQTYALEFGQLYMRVYQNGGIVLESNQNIIGATQANPVELTVTGHGYSTGDEVFVTSVVGMTELNSKFYTITVTGANTFTLDGIDGTAFTAYTSGGVSGRVYTVTMPYVADDLALLKFRQSNDVLYLTHPSYAPRKLTRTGAAAWTIEQIDFRPEQARPTGLSVSVNNTAESTTYKYQVTAVAEETSEESLLGTEAAKPISGATQADPVVVTVTSHGYSNDDVIYIESVGGMTELNDREYTIANVATNTFELVGVDGTGYTAYTSGGSSLRTATQVTNGNDSTADNTISWTAAAGAASYSVYKEDNGLFGFIGSTESTSFTDDNIAADLEDTSPKWRQPFDEANDYPSAPGLHEQRSVWGRTNNKPLNVFLSQTSQFENLNVSSPTKATDAVTVRLVTGEGNEVRHFRSFKDRLMIFTSGAIWSLRPGGDADAITPASKQLEVEEILPTTDTPPLVIKNNVLIISGEESKGFEVHSLGYELQTDAYVGSDLSVLAREEFEGYTISEWCYIHRPHRLVCAVRSDGKLLVMSYFQEHQVYAWTIWETDGLFESVAAVGEGQDDRLYAVIKRTVEGSDVRYVERLHLRPFDNIEDAFFVDAGLSLDITNAQTVTGATQSNPIVVTVNGHGYSNGDLVYLSGIGGMTEIDEREFTVNNVTANTFELLNEDGTGYAAYTSGGTAQLYTKTITGLDHIEGKAVVVLVDGNIEDELTVTNGSITTLNGGAKFHVGLPYTGTLQSLPLEVSVDSLSRNKLIQNVTTRVQDTRGLFIGPDLNEMEEYPSRSTERWGEAAATRSTVIKIPIKSDWDRDQGFFVQSEPGLPQTLLSWIPGVDFG